MQWNRAKTILIVIFLAVNVCLLAYYLHSIQTIGMISPEAINDTITILADRSITVDKSIIPATMQDVRVFDATNSLGDKESIALNFLGEGYFVTDTYEYANGPYFLRFTDRGYTLTVDQSIASDSPPSAPEWTDSGCRKFIEETLTNYKISGKQISLLSFEMDDSKCTAVYIPVFDYKPVADSSVTVTLTPFGLSSIVSNNWLGDNFLEGAHISVAPVTTALIRLANNEDIDPMQTHTITAVSEGYYLGHRNWESKTVLSIPVWIIEMDGHQYLYDARSGTPVI